MAGQAILVNFSPGRVLIIPHQAPYSSNSYLYLEGPVAFTSHGIVPQSGAVGLEVFPVTIGGKPGGMLRSSGAPGANIRGDQGFAGDYFASLPGNRVLLIRPMLGGQFQFFAGPQGGVAVQLTPIPINRLQVMIPAQAHSHPVKLKGKP